MRRSRAHGSSRHGLRPRRLLLIGAILALPTAAAGSQDPTIDKIQQRQVRLARAPDGGYSVIEVLELAVRGNEDTVTLLQPVALIRLPDAARGTRWLGGALSPGHLRVDGDRLAVIGRIPGGTLRFAAGYRLMADVPELRLEALVPVDELSLFVDRGSIVAQPDPALVAAGEGGPSQQPRLEYTARDIAPGEAFRIGLVDERLGWRQRFAVLLATAVLAGLAGVAVWRRGERWAQA